jgi:hypothetical protein
MVAGANPHTRCRAASKSPRFVLRLTGLSFFAHFTRLGSAGALTVPCQLIPKESRAQPTQYILRFHSDAAS